ncbi:hypothetical protein F7725_019210 [Dissostichus mawsoni]|uniref:Uncharacterized protein n=1 Tax=Dissostichus mawsoni TaxID=36200 RepID=A0A7J5YKJ8_DISMA|nr:hypothetical protein F7725_019210 [Dissostichus mawsoni]
MGKRSHFFPILAANRKINEQRKIGGGPPPADFTPAEELALSKNADDGENVVLLPPPNHPLPHTEEGLADDETLSVYSESALAEEGTLPPPQPGPSTSRPSTSRPSTSRPSTSRPSSRQTKREMEALLEENRDLTEPKEPCEEVKDVEIEALLEENRDLTEPKEPCEEVKDGGIDALLEENQDLKEPKEGCEEVKDGG